MRDPRKKRNYLTYCAVVYFSAELFFPRRQIYDPFDID